MSTLRLKRRLTVVEGCPQPESPIKPVVQYGFLGGHKLERLAPSSLAHEASIIARAQSLRTRNGVVPEPLNYADSLRIVAQANKPKRVTVPNPR